MEEKKEEEKKVIFIADVALEKIQAADIPKEQKEIAVAELTELIKKGKVNVVPVKDLAPISTELNALMDFTQTPSGLQFWLNIHKLVYGK